MLKIKNKELSVTPGVINVMLKAVDQIKLMIDTYRKDLDAKIDVSGAINIFTHFEDQVSLDINPTQTFEGEETLVSINESFQVKSGFNSQGGSVIEISGQNTEISNPTKGTHSLNDQGIRVSLKKVETLIDYVGEMVILQAFLKEQLQHINNSVINRSLAQMAKVSKEIQNIAMSLRMVPVKPTLQKLVRTIRDVANLLGKEVDVIVEGEETELDKTVLEKMTDPLVHLVRNAVDHGIEPKEIRLSRGKPRKGP